MSSGRALELALSMPWAITEDYLRTIVNVAARTEVFPDAIAFREGEPVGNRDVSMRDGGIAVIPVTGPIFRRANLFMRFSGGTSTELLALDIGAALRDPGVQAIVLEVDSPGGEANGTAEVAEMIYRARAEKPVYAFVGDLGASGAYWLASAATRVITSPTGLLGSIGVRTAFLDDREALEKRGLREIEIVSSQSPNKAADPTTDRGRAEIQRVIDDLADVFVGAVARNRGVERSAVIERFGRGGLLVGQLAVDAGLADEVATFEEMLEGIRNPERAGAGRPTIQEETMSEAKKTTETPEITTAFIAEQHPEIADHFRAEGKEAGLTEGRAEGREAGATAERERIQSIEALAAHTPGHRAMVDQLKYEPEMTAEKAALRIVAAEGEKRAGQITKLRADEGGLDAPSPSTEGDARSEDDKAVALILHAGQPKENRATA